VAADWQPGAVMTKEHNLAVLESAIIEMFEAILEIDWVNRESHFYACGGDSLSALELVDRLSSRLSLDIDAAELPLWSSVSSIAEFLQGMLTAADRQNLD
jgi:acyl carrier protein